MEENKVIVNQKKSGNILYIFGTFVFAGLCIVPLFFNLRDQDTGLIGLFTQNEITYWILKAVFVACAALFGYAGIFFIKRAKAGNAILIADEKGITDNSSATASGFIPWCEIENIYIDSMSGNEFIELKLINEEQFLSQFSALKRRTLNLNKKLGHQPICITLNTTGIKPEEILPKLLNLLENYRTGY